MSKSLEVLFAPAEFAALASRDLSHTVCVVFDILRATSTMMTALANGALEIIPVAEIPEALALRRARPELLLAGERGGYRIDAAQTGGVDFDLGNSPREFTPEVVRGRSVVMSTTNGTRALRACLGAEWVLIGAFLNLKALVRKIETLAPERLLLVCAGTVDQAAFEDILAAGAVADALWSRYQGGGIADSALVACQSYQTARDHLDEALRQARNGRKLLAIPELRDDVAWCARQDVCELVAHLRSDGSVRVLS